MADKKEILPAIPPTLAIQTMDAKESIKKVAASSPDGFTVLNLDKISFPTAGSLTFTVPTEDGEEPKRYLDGIIIHSHDYRQKYDGPYDVQNPTPPDCVSYDGVRGEGDPGGVCRICPFNIVGAEAKCKPYRWLYILFPDEPLPARLAIPRTSLNRQLVRGFARYVARLAKGGTAKTKGGLWLHEAFTRIGLEKRERGIGQVATFQELGAFPPDQRAYLSAYAEDFKKYVTFPALGVRSRDINPDMYGGEGETPNPDDEDYDGNM